MNYARNQRIPRTLVGAVFAMAVLPMFSCSKKTTDAAASTTAVTPAAGTQAPVSKVTTAGVEMREMPTYLTLTGNVLADQESQIAANASGRITAVYIERGQPVKKGQAIASVDAKAAGFQAAAAAAQSQAATSNVELAKQDCARAESLFAKGAMPQSEYERQKTLCTAQLYGANAARAQADLANKLASDTTVRSPIDGVVNERFVEVGEYVQTSSPVASVYSVSRVRITISVPEPWVSQVHQGQLAHVEVSAYPGRTFPAVVRFLGSALRPDTRDLIIEAFAENPEHALLPGMYATVHLITGGQKVATVPVEAIKTEGTTRRLFLVKEGAAYEMVVRTGVEQEGHVAVLDNLTANDRVIVQPSAELRDGTKVE